ncbi:unnamed protein product, partial [Rotaria sordida]
MRLDPQFLLFGFLSTLLCTINVVHDLLLCLDYSK